MKIGEELEVSKAGRFLILYEATVLDSFLYKLGGLLCYLTRHNFCNTKFIKRLEIDPIHRARSMKILITEEQYEEFKTLRGWT